eukprot:COSAG01_NODE_39203_length_479_cov_2.152632_1_plen_147_part_00
MYSRRITILVQLVLDLAAPPISILYGCTTVPVRTPYTSVVSTNPIRVLPYRYKDTRTAMQYCQQPAAEMKSASRGGLTANALRTARQNPRTLAQLEPRPSAPPAPADGSKEAVADLLDILLNSTYIDAAQQPERDFCIHPHLDRWM